MSNLRAPSIKRTRHTVQESAGRVAPVGVVELDTIDNREHAAWMQRVTEFILDNEDGLATVNIDLTSANGAITSLSVDIADVNAKIDAHTARTDNPHTVTLAQVGGEAAGAAAAAVAAHAAETNPHVQYALQTALAQEAADRTAADLAEATARAAADATERSERIGADFVHNSLTNAHNVGADSYIVGTGTVQTLTNKTIDGDDNTLQDIALTSLKTVLADADKVIRRDSSGVVVSDNALPNSSEIVTIDATQTLTNKTVPDLQFDLTGPDRALTEGLVYWDDTNKTLAVKLSGPDVALQLGQELHVRCINKTGSDIANGKLVYIAGAHGNRPKIVLAKADADATAWVIGMTTEAIKDNGTGYVTFFGEVRDLDTSAYTAGDVLYLSASSAGAFTGSAPAFPNYDVEIGHVLVVDGSAGIILLNPKLNPTNHVMLNHLGAKDAKIGAIGDGDYTEFEADGTMVAVGEAKTWDDSQAAVIYMRTDGTALTLDRIIPSTGTLYQYRFDLNDEIHSQIQISHRYMVDSTVHLHIHLLNQAAIGATNYNVGIEVEWAWAGINKVMSTPATESTVDCSFQNASAYTHKVFDLKAIAPASGTGTISSILFLRIKRVAGTTQSYTANDIFVLGVDCHVEQDTLGSRDEYIK